MFRNLLVNFSLLLPISTFAATPAAMIPEDFATGMHLQTSGNSPFYRIALPEAIYTGAAHPDLRDIRVFNHNGESLPFALVSEPTPTRVQAKTTKLQAFKLPTHKEGDIDTGTVIVQRDNVHLSWSKDLQNDRPQILLMSTSKKESEQTITLSSIKLDWADSNNSWQQDVILESSSDLSYWNIVETQLPLMDLKQNGQRLRVDTLKFPSTTARYWRLTLTEAQTPELKSITGIEQTESSSTPLTWIKPSKTEKPETWQRIYQFALAQPIESLKISLPQANTVLPYTLEYRDNPKNTWQPLVQNVAWRLNRNNGNEHESPALELNGTYASELRLSAGPAGWGSGEPTLEIGRHNQHLYFNARGSNPYLLTWGSAAAPAANLLPESLIPGYNAENWNNYPETSSSDTLELGGEKRRFEPSLAERQARWQTQLLWVVLIAGVAGLAGLAFKLWREMGAKVPASETTENE